jgi:hypothetical protein
VLDLNRESDGSVYEEAPYIRRHQACALVPVPAIDSMHHPAEASKGLSPVRRCPARSRRHPSSQPQLEHVPVPSPCRDRYIERRVSVFVQEAQASGLVPV